MESIAHNSNRWSLFGFDLRLAWRYYRMGLQQLLGDAVCGLRRYVESPILVHAADSDQKMVYTDAGPGSAAPSACRWHALLLPEQLVLERELALPKSIEPELAETVAMEVQASSPFPPDMAEYAWRITGRDTDMLRVSLAIVTREALGTVTRTPPPDLQGCAFELWHVSRNGVPLVFTGQSESQRDRAFYGGMRRVAVQAAAVVAIVLVIVAIPLGALAARASSVERTFTEVRSNVADEMELRERLGTQNELLATLRDVIADLPATREALGLLAAQAPDGVYLNQLDLDGRRLRLSGYATNAADYMQQLSSATWLEAVAAPTAFQRDPRIGRERFTIEAQINLAAGDATQAQGAGP